MNRSLEQSLPALRDRALQASRTEGLTFDRLLPVFGLALVLGFSAEVGAQPEQQPRQPAPEAPGLRQIVRSLSGRFIINGPRMNLSRMTNSMAGLKRNEVFLDAPVLAISAERIKDALCAELQVQDKSANPIFVNLLPPASPPGPMRVQSARYLDGWHHRLDLPEKVDREQFVKAVVSVSLLELAGRRSNGQGAELPLWLSEGMARQLFAKSVVPLVVQTELDWQSVRYFESKRLPDVYRLARADFQTRPPLPLSGLTQPLALDTEADWEHFRCCAQLFTGELLKFPDGPSRMMEFVRLLPDYMNWQLAFLQAYRGHFRSMLDLEKWWSVTLVTFGNRDQHMKVSVEDGLMQLSQILAVPVDVRSSTDAVPEAGVTTIQSLITKNSVTVQRTVLTRVAQQLRALQWNVPTDLLKLIDDYRFTVESYLAKRGKAVEATGRVTIGQTVPSLVRETVQKLDLLDQLHADFATYGIKSVSTVSNGLPAAK